MKDLKLLLVIGIFFGLVGCGEDEGNPPTGYLTVYEATPCSQGENMLTIGNPNSGTNTYTLSSGLNRAAQLFTVTCNGATPGISMYLQSVSSSQSVAFDLYRGRIGLGTRIGSDSFTVGTSGQAYIIFSGDNIPLEAGESYWIRIQAGSGGLKIGYVTGNTNSDLTGYTSSDALTYTAQSYDFSMSLNSQ
tara:strand:- start:1185 stop:1754 length:570 start_codon:yes stop_codon:yes gene_type:complete